MGIMVMRAVVGVALLQAGAILFGTKAVERPLAVTLLILGGFSIANLLADFIFLKLRKMDLRGKDDEDAAPAPPAPPVPPSAPAVQTAIQQRGALPGFLESAAFYVTTPAFVLALLSLFGDRHGPTITLKVGSVALAATLLTGLALHGYVSATTDETPRAKTFVHLVFNLALWLFALGVVSIAISIVYQ